MNRHPRTIRVRDLPVARPGWTERYRPLVDAARVVGLTAFLLGMLGIGFLYLWLPAPEGAR